MRGRAEDHRRDRSARRDREAPKSSGSARACAAPHTGAGGFAQPRSLPRKHDDGSAAEPTCLLTPCSRDAGKVRLLNAD